jgi:hypothetical protein
MQTFLPFPDFDASAKCLYKKQLGNQFYREGLTLLRGKWSNHPAAKMWRSYRGVDYKGSLCRYLFALYDELKVRGKDYAKHHAEVLEHFNNSPDRYLDPPWLGDPAFHSSHRSNLLRKDVENGWGWYCDFGWEEPCDLPYVWPC